VPEVWLHPGADDDPLLARPRELPQRHPRLLDHGHRRVPWRA